MRREGRHSVSAVVEIIDRKRQVQFTGRGNLANAGRTRIVDRRISGSLLHLKMSSLVFSFLRRTRTMAAMVVRLVSHKRLGR